MIVRKISEVKTSLDYLGKSRDKNIQEIYKTLKKEFEISMRKVESNITEGTYNFSHNLQEAINDLGLIKDQYLLNGKKAPKKLDKQTNTLLYALAEIETMDWKQHAVEDSEDLKEGEEYSEEAVVLSLLKKEKK